jgi:protein-disulfide isomerase
MAAPTIFFDGRQIPGEYSFKDLESILRVKLNEDE